MAHPHRGWRGAALLALVMGLCPGLWQTAPSLAHPGHTHVPRDFYKNFLPMSRPMPAGASQRLRSVIQHLQTADVNGLMADYPSTGPAKSLEQTRQIFSHPLTRALFMSMRFTPLSWEPGKDQVRVRLKVSHPHRPLLQRLFKAFGGLEHRRGLASLDKKNLLAALQKGNYPRSTSETLMVLVQRGGRWYTITLPLPDMEKNPGHTSAGAPETVKSRKTKPTPSPKPPSPSPSPPVPP